MLINEHVDCGTFTLVGIDDPVTHRENMYKAFRHVSPSKPIFVLTHFHPDSLLSEFEYRGVDLVFSGHTHGGQTSLVPLIGLVPYAYRSRFTYGLYTIHQLRLVVTRGIGTSIFPFRFLCRPEIVIMKLTGE
jgi:predicted MPP superfamily phosphohydrolase